MSKTNLGVSKTPRDHLIIPDAHTHPGDNPRRFAWLNNLILDRKPEVIVQIGDWWDMGSLCSYDAGKKEFVFQNLKDDIETGHQAEEIAFGPIINYNNYRLKEKKKGYNPIIIKCLGNHEYRVSKLLQYEPRWEGTISMDDFNTRIEGLNEVVIPFLETCSIDGIAYSHYFVSGVQGRPASSARALLAKTHMSATMGHTHTLDSHDSTNPLGNRSRALVCGSFHDKEHAGFAGPQVDQIWWNGLIYKHNVLDGEYDREEIGIERLEELYG